MSGVELLLIICIFSFVVLVPLIYGTVVRNRWGVSTERVVCPGCHTPLPFWRKPTSLRQALWGGHSCPNCHRELDKWGREVST
jgi:predicted amidophosphoribosyltransferase